MMQIIVTGASGLLGREIMKILSRDCNVEGWAFRRTEKLKRVNLLAYQEVEEAFYQFSPDILIHSAAERKPDVMDKQPEKAWELNVGVTKHLAQLSQSSGSHFIFISTDYIFDETSPPYKEESVPGALNLYGKSKAKAEEIIQENCSRYAITEPIP